MQSAGLASTVAPCVDAHPPRRRRLWPQGRCRHRRRRLPPRPCCRAAGRVALHAVPGWTPPPLARCSSRAAGCTGRARRRGRVTAVRCGRRSCRVPAGRSWRPWQRRASTPSRHRPLPAMARPAATGAAARPPPPPPPAVVGAPATAVCNVHALSTWRRSGWWPPPGGSELDVPLVLAPASFWGARRRAVFGDKSPRGRRPRPIRL